MLISSLVIIAGCSQPAGKDDAAARQTVADVQAGSAGIVNPIVEKENARQIGDETGVYLKIPDGAADVKYYVIALKVAQIEFSFRGEEFTLRGAKELSGIELHGVYGQPLERNCDGNDTRGSFDISLIPRGPPLTWSDPGAKYSLYAGTSAGDDTNRDSFESVRLVELYAARGRPSRAFMNFFAISLPRYALAESPALGARFSGDSAGLWYCTRFIIICLRILRGLSCPVNLFKAVLRTG